MALAPGHATASEVQSLLSGVVARMPGRYHPHCSSLAGLRALPHLLTQPCICTEGVARLGDRLGLRSCQAPPIPAWSLGSHRSRIKVGSDPRTRGQPSGQSLFPQSLARTAFWMGTGLSLWVSVPPLSASDRAHTQLAGARPATQRTSCAR